MGSVSYSFSHLLYQPRDTIFRLASCDGARTSQYWSPHPPVLSLVLDTAVYVTFHVTAGNAVRQSYSHAETIVVSPPLSTAFDNTHRGLS